MVRFQKVEKNLDLKNCFDMNKIYNKYILYLALGLIVFLILFINQSRYNRLQNKYNRLKIESIEQIDSLTYINREHMKKISEFELEINELENTVDSLEQVKNKIIIKKDQVIVSSTISEGVQQLKDNLER